jgi:hypothetical protein
MLKETPVGKKHTRATSQWHTMDIHIHTPASSDFQQPEASYLDILQRAEARGLEIIAFTDHNTVAGYRRMKDEIAQLELLEKLSRLLPEEKNRLNEYRRLMNKILVCPGIEFTATFGFHILGIFSPDKPYREIEHLLLSLNIPPNLLDDGSANVGATSDVITAYRSINQAGGLVIAAHANSTNGVAMRGFNFGGQTKIAYTQDPNLNALEVTDLDVKGSRSTAAFFNGTKPEYPRRMHCIQGSDAHRLVTDSNKRKNPGIGERATDVFLPEVSFEALQELFLNNDFSRTRPNQQQAEQAFDFLQAALEEGPNIIQDFHESLTVRGGKLYDVLADICAFGNTNGGTLYIGFNSDLTKPPIGVPDAEQAIIQLGKEIVKRISPPFQCTLDTHESKGKKIIRILVPRGSDPPYALDDNKIYVRSESETGLAVRDEIVGLVLRSKPSSAPTHTDISHPPEGQLSSSQAAEIHNDFVEDNPAPLTGVEVLPPEEREGALYYSMRDLRNGNVVKNVTRTSARRLWHYALSQYGEAIKLVNGKNIQWQGNIGLIKHHKQGQIDLYDLVQKSSGGYRYYFGVTLNGIHGPWKSLLGMDE